MSDPCGPLQLAHKPNSVSSHMGPKHASREKKITYGKFFDFWSEKCVYN